MTLREFHMLFMRVRREICGVIIMRVLMMSSDEALTGVTHAEAGEIKEPMVSANANRVSESFMLRVYAQFPRMQLCA